MYVHYPSKHMTATQGVANLHPVVKRENNVAVLQRRLISFVFRCLDTGSAISLVSSSINSLVSIKVSCLLLWPCIRIARDARRRFFNNKGDTS